MTAFTSIQLGNYNNHLIWRLLIDNTIDASKFANQLTKFYYQRHYNYIITHNELDETLDQFLRNFKHLQDLQEELDPLHQEWQTLPKPTKSEFSASISERYNPIIKQICEEITNSNLKYYTTLLPYYGTKRHWKNIDQIVNYFNQIKVEIKAGQSDPHQNDTLIIYAKKSFKLPKEITQDSFDEFLKQYDYSANHAKLILSYEFEKVMTPNINPFNTDTPTAEIEDDYDWY